MVGLARDLAEVTGSMVELVVSLGSLQDTAGLCVCVCVCMCGGGGGGGVCACACGCVHVCEYSKEMKGII